MTVRLGVRTVCQAKHLPDGWIYYRRHPPGLLILTGEDNNNDGKLCRVYRPKRQAPSPSTSQQLVSSTTTVQTTKNHSLLCLLVKMSTEAETVKPIEDPKPVAEEEPDTKKQKMTTPQSPDEGTNKFFMRYVLLAARCIGVILRRKNIGGGRAL